MVLLPCTTQSISEFTVLTSMMTKRTDGSTRLVINPNTNKSSSFLERYTMQGSSTPQQINAKNKIKCRPDHKATYCHFNYAQENLGEDGPITKLAFVFLLLLIYTNTVIFCKTKSCVPKYKPGTSKSNIPSNPAVIQQLVFFFLVIWLPPVA